ncbi:hypothetical protein [Leptolyngbya sp. GGD]|uniref:hypothetical protein n=1 Tax=Leptolyngbya sp. GGD TaxID=2997907 RepID=UPI00227C6563|nr:hypothetical protein [Leptolyngbya sp. GGD]MCY6493392.1 hypothetical protein [Leptolyngbya sp. GGD]
MPHPKRQSSTHRKPTTERQIILARRSRSIKASLLKVLSLDLVTLYLADQAEDSDKSPARNPSHPMPRPDFHSPAELHETTRFISPNTATPVRPIEQPVTQSGEAELQQEQPSNAPYDSKGVSRPASPIAIVIIRCFAFLLGMLIRCILIFYLQPFAALLSGVAIALSGISVLIVVVFTPWKQKLLWNLGCLFGGLLLAVLML